MVYCVQCEKIKVKGCSILDTIKYNLLIYWWFQCSLSDYHYNYHCWSLRLLCLIYLHLFFCIFDFWKENQILAKCTIQWHLTSKINHIVYVQCKKIKIKSCSILDTIKYSLLIYLLSLLSEWLSLLIINSFESDFIF